MTPVQLRHLITLAELGSFVQAADALCLTQISMWAAVEPIAPKIGCVPQTLLEWVKRVEVDAGVREGVTTSEAQRVY